MFMPMRAHAAIIVVRNPIDLLLEHGPAADIARQK